MDRPESQSGSLNGDGAEEAEAEALEVMLISDGNHSRHSPSSRRQRGGRRCRSEPTTY